MKLFANKPNLIKISDDSFSKSKSENGENTKSIENSNIHNSTTKITSIMDKSKPELKPVPPQYSRITIESLEGPTQAPRKEFLKTIFMKSHESIKMKRLKTLQNLVKRKIQSQIKLTILRTKEINVEEINKKRQEVQINHKGIESTFKKPKINRPYFGESCKLMQDSPTFKSQIRNSNKTNKNKKISTNNICDNKLLDILGNNESRNNYRRFSSCIHPKETKNNDKNKAIDSLMDKLK